MLHHYINDPASLRHFPSPLDRLVAIIERFLPTPVKADFVPRHYGYIISLVSRQIDSDAST